MIKMIRMKKDRKSNIKSPCPVYFKTGTATLISDKTDFR